MRILLAGARGQVGRELAPRLAVLGDLTATDSTTLDLSNETATREAVRSLRPQVIVNAAAYTAVDAAESDEAAARRLNADAPRILAEEAARLGALLVHYSTDYVFDGTAGRPYSEEDVPRPLNAYGRTKLAGERAIQDVGCRHLIFRLAWVYSRHGRNFLRTMLRLAREQRVIRVVDDQVGSPTWARAAAEATVGVIAHHPDRSRSGLYHLAAPDGCSWHTFATAILAHDPRPAEQVVRQVEAISSGDYPTPARRPPYSLLSPERAAATFGVQLPSWQDQLQQCLNHQ